ncbi:MAG TPA: carboxypeptidase-like regulatory domain-containing protein, partial [Terracidiphilus sp.]|nr:carboxypeptidase-like regulatory domain-containing protein [Terracidiphilus sp.]
MRPALFLFSLLFPALVFACKPSNPSAPLAGAAVQGVVADATGAIVPGAEVDLVDPSGEITTSGHSGDDGSFQLTAPHFGSYTLVVSEPGFDTVRNPVSVAPPAISATTTSTARTFAAPIHIVLPVAALATNVRVTADSSEDLTAPEDNHDSSVMTANDLKALPIFDNDYAAAMSAFLDDSATATGGSGLIVDGVEANRATVSPSAVQEVRINQDPYSAQYYRPGRGQMEIVSKSAADHYHGQFNFYFRDSAFNAQNALAPSKPFEQRRIYEGHFTGPIPHFAKSSFLGTFNREEEDVSAVVKATLLPTADSPSGAFNANVPAPTRDTEFSLRASHQFGERHSAYAQYSYEDWTGQNQAVGG